MKNLFFLTICIGLLIASPRKNIAQTSDEVEFVTETYEDGLLKIKLGELAQTKGSVASVKDFSKTLTTDYSKAGDELKALAKNKNIALPSELSKKGQRKYDRLTKREGHSFDKEYMDYMIENHDDAIDEFGEMSEESKDADIKAWTLKMLPSLKRNLETAKSIYKAIK